MIIGCSIDNRFAELAGVMLHSLDRNGCLPDAEVIILCDQVTADNEKKIASCTERNVTFVPLSKESTSRIARLPTTNHWSRATYGRLFLPDFIDASHERLLYLDADTIINGDLSQLATLDLQEMTAAAVCKEGDAHHNLQLGRKPSSRYFNAGVLLMDLKKWREHNLTARAFETLEQNAKGFKFLDQDVLNIILENEVLDLPEKWNFTSQSGDFSDVRIIHFTHAKPNTIECHHAMRDVYLEYRKRTPWANAQLRRSKKIFFLRWIHSLLKIKNRIARKIG